MVEVMRVANRTKDYTQIDALIRQHIPKFLYNDGEGKLVESEVECSRDRKCRLQVTISEIVKRRNNTYSKVKSIVAASKSDEEQINGERRLLACDNEWAVLLGEETKRVCWDLDQRGGVGEQILHICFLSSSPVHTALAKRLLRHYPKMIYDLYMGDEYYGSFAFARALRRQVVS